MALILYGSSLSPFVRKVRVVLAEKGLDYSLEQINPFAPPDWFIAISPLKRIPVLRDTDEPEPNTLPDSSVISAYIEQKWPTPSLYPAEPFARGRALWFEEYADTLVAECIGRGFFFERVVKKFLGGECDETIVAATVAERLPAIFAYLEQALGDRRFLVGDSFSIADIAVATMLVNFDHAGGELDTGRWPQLSRFMAEMHARPSFHACIESERNFLARQRAA
jgi:glutathione S-transferase